MQTSHGRSVPSYTNSPNRIGCNLTNRYLDGIHEDLTSGDKRLPTLEEFNANANAAAEYAENVADIRQFMVSFCNIDAEQMLHLYEADWHPRRVLQNIEDYDAEQKAWIYRIQVECNIRAREQPASSSRKFCTPATNSIRLTGRSLYSSAAKMRALRKSKNF